jgi:hypothetical protein
MIIVDFEPIINGFLNPDKVLRELEHHRLISRGVQWFPIYFYHRHKIFFFHPNVVEFERDEG